LEELIHRVVIEKKTFCVTDSLDPLEDADYILIDVQTPVDERYVPQYVSLKEVSAEAGKRMKRGACVIIESTCAPGTTSYIVKDIIEKSSGMKAGEDFHLAFSYERVMVGRLLHNIINLPRIVGGFSPECTRKAVWLYKHFVKAELLETDCLTAEVAKVVENAYRDVNIAFANEVALACESLGVDVFDVRRFVNSLPNDPSNPSANPVRNLHFPGAGVGGHCLPKDSWLLKYGLDTYGTFKFEPKVIMESRFRNDLMPHHMIELLKEAMEEMSLSIKGAKVCVLGYAFLENSDDTRNTPSRPLILELQEIGADVVVHDPYLKEEDGITIHQDLDYCLKDSDAVVLITKHKEYFDLEMARMKELLKTPIIIDGRNVWSPSEARSMSFVYKGIGKKKH